MKKSVYLASLAVIAGLGFNSIHAFAADDTSKSIESTGKISFKADDSKKPTVDPENPDPEKPIDPEKPNPGTNGPLSIDYASQFDFGEQVITTKDMTYNATLDKKKETDGTLTDMPNFVQVTDTRGTLEGWTLGVKQDAQLTADGTTELTGAEMSFKKAEVASIVDVAYKPGTVKNTLTLVPGVLENVVDAGEGQGAGTWVYRFGENVENGKDAVQLEVPGKTVKLVKEYSTKLTWTLSAKPSNTPIS